MAQGPAYASNYPNRFTYGVTIGGTPVVTSQPGNVYWVNNSSVLPPGGVAGVNAPWPTAGTYLRPFNTIDYAIGQCVAGRGDIINVMPSHVEAVSTAAGIDFDVDAITVNGIGVGLDQPKVTFTATTSTVEVNADGVTINGLNFEATVSAVAVGISVLDGADDFRIINNRFTCETLTTDEFLCSILVTTSDRGIISGNYFDMDEAGAATGIKFAGVCLGGEVTNNYITGDYSTACINSITTAQEQILIDGNTLINGAHSGLNTVGCIVLLTGTTGVIQNNQIYTNVASASTAAIVADACFLGGGNWISTTAESAPFAPESGGVNGLVYSTVKATVADEATAVLWDVTGVVDLYGIIGRASTAFNSAVQVSLATDCTDETLNQTLSTAVEAQVLTVVGDSINSAQVGSILVATEAPGDLTPLWAAPTRVTAGVINQVIGGTPGAGATSYTCYWSPVTAGATVAIE